MENEKGLFDLSVDATGRAHLKETAGWAKFFAILGFLGTGLLVLYTFTMASASSETATAGTDDTPEIVYAIIVSICLIALCFFPCLFTLRFAGRMLTALESNDTAQLNEAFKNLKITIRYLGVVSVIVLLLVLTGLLSEI